MLQSIKEVGFESGFEQGLKKGTELRFEQDLRKGIEQGKRQTTLRHVKGMLDYGFDWKFITKVTGITDQKFKKIQESSPL